jgi:hypothetical protein
MDCGAARFSETLEVAEQVTAMFTTPVSRTILIRWNELSFAAA